MVMMDAGTVLVSYLIAAVMAHFVLLKTARTRLTRVMQSAARSSMR
jgi:hypothetical protein